MSCSTAHKDPFHYKETLEGVSETGKRLMSTVKFAAWAPEAVWERTLDSRGSKGFESWFFPVTCVVSLCFMTWHCCTHSLFFAKASPGQPMNQAIPEPIKLSDLPCCHLGSGTPFHLLQHFCSTSFSRDLRPKLSSSASPWHPPSLHSVRWTLWNLTTPGREDSVAPMWLWWRGAAMPQDRYHWWRDRERRRGSSSGSSSRSSSSHSEPCCFRVCIALLRLEAETWFILIYFSESANIWEKWSSK